MNIGKLDERITFRRKSLTPDGMGGQDAAEANIPTTPTVWAQVTNMSGTENFTEQRMEATARMLFRIRYRSDIQESDIILWRGKLHNIRHIDDQGPRQRFLTITTDQGVAT